jgi:hypothetical protein
MLLIMFLWRIMHCNVTYLGPPPMMTVRAGPTACFGAVAGDSVSRYEADELMRK